ncbi:MAG: hypothetical protein J2P27_18280 [Actinobacteria bacterium]|nr:hypothetical protein [Actinomycetota bacterium]
METVQLDPGDNGQRPRWSHRTRRIVTTSAIFAIILGAGTAIGITVTGGASAATSPSPAASRSGINARCARIIQRATNAGHGIAAAQLRAVCGRPLLRLALVGGEHGQVTFKGATGPVTDAFERGTVQSRTSSAITVRAADGTTWTWAISSSTAVRQHGSKVQASAIKTGERVLVEGRVVNGANDARLIRLSRAA